jgi:acyl-CoA thioester hydrolase
VSAPVPGALAGWPVVVEVPVAWADMDYFRHVNHAVFFRYMEAARIEYLERIAFREVDGVHSVGPILASAEARFRQPVVYPDTVAVGARTVEVGDDRFTMAYRVVSRKTGGVAAEGGAVLVSYDYAAARKTPLPAPVREAIRALEAAAG